MSALIERKVVDHMCFRFYTGDAFGALLAAPGQTLPLVLLLRQQAQKR